jgi:parallel beta-helix repeat protein
MCIILIPRISDYNYLSAEIMIRSDDDLVKYNLPGSGTENDPYRIENLTINTRKNGILVTQISKSLIIRNCTITAGVNGIRICGNYKSTNIVIENNTCIISPRKIRTLYSYNCYVQNIGIQASYASNIVIRNNYCYHISNYNRYSFGIFLMYVMNVSVLNNICYNSYSGMYVNANENVSLINNTCYNNYQGFTIDGRNLILLNNNCSSNFYGMYFWYSLNNTISYNNLENNSIGIHFYNSDNNTIFYNQIHYCTSYAICVGNRSNDNIFHHNNLFNNSQHYPLQTQVFDDGINFWYDIEFGENGNYWSDLIWYLGCQYEIDGGSNTDPYPLQHPVDI